MNLAELIANGGVTMIPLLVLSVLSIGTILERIWFWSRVFVYGTKATRSHHGSSNSKLGFSRKNCP